MRTIKEGEEKFIEIAINYYQAYEDFHLLAFFFSEYTKTPNMFTLSKKLLQIFLLYGKYMLNKKHLSWLKKIKIMMLFANVNRKKVRN